MPVLPKPQGNQAAPFIPIPARQSEIGTRSVGLQDRRPVEQPIRVAHQLDKGLFGGGEHMAGVVEALAGQPCFKMLGSDCLLYTSRCV